MGRGVGIKVNKKNRPNKVPLGRTSCGDGVGLSLRKQVFEQVRLFFHDFTLLHENWKNTRVTVWDNFATKIVAHSSSPFGVPPNFVVCTATVFTECGVVVRIGDKHFIRLPFRVMITIEVGLFFNRSSFLFFHIFPLVEFCWPYPTRHINALGDTANYQWYMSKNYMPV